MQPLNRVTVEQRSVGAPGEASTQLLRLTDPTYADCISEPREGVNAAEISQTLFTQNGEDIPNALGLNELWVTWGQFLDHDIGLTPEGSTEKISVEGLIAPVSRSIFDPATGTDPSNPRQQVSVMNALTDSSNVYGSDANRLAALRTFESGSMKTSEGLDGVDHLPLNTDGLPNAGDTDPNAPLFVAGDVRANENVALTVAHNLLVNEHNYWADRLASEHPNWTDEELFQGARSIVEALAQKITYEEYLPLLVGEGVLPELSDNPDGIDPGITNEFSAAAFRFAHSMVSPFQTRIDEDGSESPGGPLAVEDAFFDNTAITEGGIASLLRGISETTAQELDTKMIDDLNFFLQSPDGTVGFSLAAIDIVRGRDHGLPSYIDARAALLGDVDPAATDPTDFSVITSDPQVQADLAAAYETVDQVDLWVGCLAEDKVPGAATGATFQFILVEQFTRIRDADPLWYERRDWLDDDLFEEIQSTTLADIITRSGGVDHMQREAFLASDRLGGTDGRDVLVGGIGRDLIIGFDGNDRLSGGLGDDDLFGDGGRDRLSGGGGADGLNGGSGMDRLFGGNGDDELWGGDGIDILKGGRGSDQFVFKAADSGFDWVKDFDDGADRLVFEGFGADFEDLHICHCGPIAVLTIDNNLVAIVRGDEDSLDSSDVLFIA